MANVTIKQQNQSNAIKLMEKKIFYKKLIEYKHFYIMLIPVIIYYLVFQYGPIYGVIIAFKNYIFTKGIMGSPWIGLENFRIMFSDSYFPVVFKNTLIINAYKLIFGFPAPIILAIMINEVQRTKFKKVVQTITYMPHFFSWVVLSGIIMEILSPSRGMINYFITALGFKPIFFIAEPSLFRGILVASDIWRAVGFGSIVYLAAIAGINQEMYEAADVDGIGRIKKIFYITLPSIAPVIVIMMILNAGSIINDDFEQVFNLINGKVMMVGDVISNYTYQQGLVNMNFSYGAAVGLFKNIISLTLVLSANFIAKKISDDTLF